MPEFGDFGERSPEEIEQLARALSIMGSARYTRDQLDGYLTERSSELKEDADDFDRTDHYVLNDSRYEAAVKGEYDAMIVAAEALAKYQLAQEATHQIRRTLESEAARLLIAANQLHSADEITIADFSKDE